MLNEKILTKINLFYKIAAKLNISDSPGIFNKEYIKIDHYPKILNVKKKEEFIGIRMIEESLILAINKIKNISEKNDLLYDLQEIISKMLKFVRNSIKSEELDEVKLTSFVDILLEKVQEFKNEYTKTNFSNKYLYQGYDIGKNIIGSINTVFPHMGIKFEY